jgi:hypothetical protein
VDLAPQIRALIDGAASPISVEEIMGRVSLSDDETGYAPQIRDLIDGAASPITVEEIKARARRVPQPPRRRSRRWRSLVLALVIPLVLPVIGATVLLAPSSSPPAAAAALDQASTVAASQPASAVPGAGQYLYYTESENVVVTFPVAGTAPVLFQTLMTTQTWVAPDGSGRQSVSYSPWSPVLASDNQAWVAAGSPQPSDLTNTDTTFPTSSTPAAGGPFTTSASGQVLLTYPAPADIPTDPTALKTYLVDRYGTGDSAIALFQTAGELLQQGVSPDVRAALFQVIKSLPGIILVGNTATQAGVNGVGVALDDAGFRYTLVFDPQTSEAFGLVTVAQTAITQGNGTFPAGTMYGFINLSASQVVASTSSQLGAGS